MDSSAKDSMEADMAGARESTEADPGPTTEPMGEEGRPGLEKRLRRLEEIVSALEADELELERALALFEEGVGHVRHAERILAETELKVEELLGDGSDGRTRPFQGDEGS